MRTVNIIGAGKVGKTLGYLLAHNQCYRVQCVLNRSVANAVSAVNFIGQGQAITRLDQLQPADLYLLTVPDNYIQSVALQLAQHCYIRSGDVVVHCSGIFTSETLQPLSAKGALIASLHPAKSFSFPEDDVHDFENTCCTLEGDENACHILKHDLVHIKAQVTRIDPNHKILYHTANVFCSNYLVTLVEAALFICEKINLSKSEALGILQPLLSGTLNRILKLGPQDALTGPIARGDHEVIKKEIQALTNISNDHECAYRALGKLTLSLAQKQGFLTPQQILQLQDALQA
jgi:predicted short-subunit dehydrogenase-like oxidoreductase (DUF2520 family)